MALSKGLEVRLTRFSTLVLAYVYTGEYNSTTSLFNLVHFRSNLSLSCTLRLHRIQLSCLKNYFAESDGILSKVAVRIRGLARWLPIEYMCWIFTKNSHLASMLLLKTLILSFCNWRNYSLVVVCVALRSCHFVFDLKFLLVTGAHYGVTIEGLHQIGQGLSLELSTWQ